APGLTPQDLGVVGIERRVEPVGQQPAAETKRYLVDLTALPQGVRQRAELGRGSAHRLARARVMQSGRRAPGSVRPVPGLGDRAIETACELNPFGGMARGHASTQRNEHDPEGRPRPGAYQT